MRRQLLPSRAAEQSKPSGHCGNGAEDGARDDENPCTTREDCDRAWSELRALLIWIGTQAQQSPEQESLPHVWLHSRRESSGQTTLTDLQMLPFLLVRTVQTEFGRHSSIGPLLLLLLLLRQSSGKRTQSGNGMQSQHWPLQPEGPQVSLQLFWVPTGQSMRTGLQTF